MGTGDEPTDTAALRLTHEESRAVLDQQLEQLTELDTKAMWTVRTAVVLLGLIASVVGVIGIPVGTRFILGATVAFGLAVCGLFLTVFVGVGTYTVPTTHLGVGATHRREVRLEAYSERAWLEVLLDEYDRWTGRMNASYEEHVRLVFWMQALMAVSLAFLFLAITLLAIGN